MWSAKTRACSTGGGLSLIDLSLKLAVWHGDHFEIVDSSLSVFSVASASAILSQVALIVVAFLLALRSITRRAQADVLVLLDASSIIFISSCVSRIRRVSVRFLSFGFGGRPAISQDIVQREQAQGNTFLWHNFLDNGELLWHNN